MSGYSPFTRLKQNVAIHFMGKCKQVILSDCASLHHIDVSLLIIIYNKWGEKSTNILHIYLRSSSYSVQKHFSVTIHDGNYIMREREAKKINILTYFYTIYFVPLPPTKLQTAQSDFYQSSSSIMLSAFVDSIVNKNQLILM